LQNCRFYVLKRYQEIQTESKNQFDVTHIV
jgi:hypothetical protein